VDQLPPGIYQDADEENADFLQRFLLISAHLTSSVEENLEFVHELFDPRITQAKWLPWLASWLAMPLLEGWDEEKRREIVQRVPSCNRKRGTAEGLKLALRLFADVKAEIHEGEWPYPGLVIGKSSTIGKDTVLSPPVFVSQCFTVELPDRKAEISRERLRTVQAWWRPRSPPMPTTPSSSQRPRPPTRRCPSCTWARPGASAWTRASVAWRTFRHTGRGTAEARAGQEQP